MVTEEILKYTYSIHEDGYRPLLVIFMPNHFKNLVINLSVHFQSACLHLHKIRRMITVIKDKTPFQFTQSTHHKEDKDWVMEYAIVILSLCLMKNAKFLILQCRLTLNVWSVIILKNVFGDLDTLSIPFEEEEQHSFWH